MVTQVAGVQDPDLGDIEELDVTVTANAAFALGDVVCLHLNITTMQWDNASVPVAGDITKGIFGVCLAAAASGAPVKVRVRGVVTAFTLATTGSAVNGTLMVPTVAKDLQWDRAIYGLTSGKFVARSLFAAAPSARTLRSVLFDGITGWGGVFGGAG